MHDIEREFKSFSDAVFAGDLAELTRWFFFPMAIYAETKVSVFQNWQMLSEYFAFFRADLQAQGAASVVTDVVAVPMMRGTSGTIWLNDKYLDAAGMEVTTSQVRYFFNLSDGAPRIALIEYQQLPRFHCFEEFGMFRQS